MSVLVTVKISGDLDVFHRSLAERGDEFVKVVDRAKAGGALHHRFATGDGWVLAIDEWESAAHFEKFFADPDMQAFVASMGGDMSAPPEITVAETLETVDQF